MEKSQTVIKNVPPIKKLSLSKTQQDFILLKRAQILIDLGEYLQNKPNTASVEKVIEIVYQETDEDDFESLVVQLAEDMGTGDFDTSQELAMELFNYFPRKSKKGYSLAEEMSFPELKSMEKDFQNFKNG